MLTKKRDVLDKNNQSHEESKTKGGTTLWYQLALHMPTDCCSVKGLYIGHSGHYILSAPWIVMTTSQQLWFVSGSFASLTSDSIVSCQLSQFSSIAGQVQAFVIWFTVTVSFDMEIF